MKSNFIKSCFLIFTVFSSSITIAQHAFTNTPPEVSPMPMKPEMTEIWDAIVLFDGKNMDQWVET
jgi:hypothetical protein